MKKFDVITECETGVCEVCGKKNMFYNIKIFEKVWSERKKGVTLHSLSGTKRRSGGADPGAGKRSSGADVKNV